MFDISLILTAHAETVIAGPTLKSAEAAVNAAQAVGLAVERTIAFDNPTEACLEYFSHPICSSWRKETYSFRDQGAVRNAAATASSGRYIAFLDADDLFSENWLVEAFRLCEGLPGKVIAHPELNWIFDRASSVLVKTGQEDESFDPYYFYFANYWDALCMAPRQAHIDVPYAPRDISSGFAYEDWQWNCETMTAGFIHRIAEDTIIFKRRRERSQTITASQRQSVIRDVEFLKADVIEKFWGGKDIL